MAEIYHDGPLKGQASITILVNANAVKWLEHASKETGYSLDRLAEISVEEAALQYAKTAKLMEAGE
ncbi:hypothetical protein [Rhizobium oryziradicis]|uniref:Uncharacterized protein n=1 Tax=Rhizobium oryziradicis TaxID=1867956 RepID=A0A1Q8ZPZ0_9HYPH|nr:hypothetical protein [Rhizobium oryziradicis]OLP44127.1 hypothetical protein BJF95_06065 [Rhizobium oryziradicis]